MEYNYLYIITNPSSEHCGEAFFVYETSKAKADAIAYNVYCEKPHFAGMYTDDEADDMGFDTY